MSTEQDALTCPTCAALVAAGGQQKHREFHEQVVTHKQLKEKDERQGRDLRSAR